MGTRPRLSPVAPAAGVSGALAATPPPAAGSPTTDTAATKAATRRVPRRADQMGGSVVLHPPLRRAEAVVRNGQHRRPRSAVTDLLSPSSISPECDGAPPPSRLRVVLDTSVLVADPGALHAYAGSDVVIPLTVIEELGSLKTRMDDVGRAARTALRTIENLRLRAGG